MAFKIPGKKIKKPSGMNISSEKVDLINKIKALESELYMLKESVSSDDKRAAEIALEHSEQRLKRAELASKSGNWELYLDTGRIVGSAGAMKLYGVTEEVFNYEFIKNFPLPEYREMMNLALVNLVQNQKPYDIEFKIKRADTGEIIDLHSVAEYDKEKRIVFGTLQDITDHKKAELQIRKKSDDLAQLLEISMNLLESVDRKKVLQNFVEGAVKLANVDTGAIYSISGNNLYLEVTTPRIPENFPEEFRKAFLENHPHIKSSIERCVPVVIADAANADFTSEEKIIVETRGLTSMLYMPLFSESRAQGVLILGTIGRMHDFDKTEINLSRTLSNIASLAFENSLLFEKMMVSLEKAEESDRLKTAFLHNISHEIRTPLNAIVGFSGFLDQPDLDDAERKKYIEIIFQSNNQLLSIINDIINISHIEAGQVSIKETTVDIPGLLENLFRQFHGEAKLKGLDLVLDYSKEEKNSELLTDGSKLSQVFTNLIGNALKFTSSGCIRYGYFSEDEQVRFFVDDTGIGIPAEEQTRIFERFYQIEKTESRQYGGMGLGLSISEAYINLLGGKFSVQSEPGKGSKFSFTLPVKKHGKKVTTGLNYFEINGNNIGPGKTILIAEDDYSNFELLSAILSPLGFKIIHASDGREAVDLFVKNSGINLVLMDLKMANMNGFEATTEILKIKPGTPVIAQTAYAHLHDQKMAVDCGCIDYLVKPLNKHHLLSVIRKHIR